jgi:putative SOS response-associated peptidase YedK
MCFSANNHNKKSVLSAKLKKSISEIPVKSQVYLSGFSHPEMYCIKQEQQEIIEVANWGLVPGFIHDPLKAREYFINTLNAKAETVFEKVSFKNSIMSKRCIIPISGFYEWMELNKMKYPHYIAPAKHDIMYVAGIYAHWTNGITREVNTTFSMITTEANPLMARIHNLKKRQPLVLSHTDSENWLNHNLNEKDVIELMQPTHDDFFTAHPIKKFSPKNVDVNSNDLIEEYFYPELALVD